MGVCGYQEKQFGRVILCDIMFHLETLYNFRIQTGYHVVVLRQMCVRNEVYS